MRPSRHATLLRSLAVLTAASTLFACDGGTRSRNQVDYTAKASAEASADEARGLAMRSAAADAEAGAAKMAVAAAAPAPAMPTGDEQSSPSSDPAMPQGTATADAGSMLIRTGNASVEVDSLAGAVTRVRELARRAGGMVANVSMQGGRDQVPTATLEIRVPSDRFDMLVEGLKPLGKVESVNVEVEDVGEEFVDVTARVENARRLESRLIELLATRTGKLGDVLQVERELARVREEIERYEGRLRYLKSRVAVSRLTVEVHEPSPITVDNPGEHPIREAFISAWRNFVGFVAWVIASLGWLIPLGAIGVLVWIGARRMLRRRRKFATA